MNIHHFRGCLPSRFRSDPQEQYFIESRRHEKLSHAQDIKID